MIGQIRGILIHKQPPHLMVDVQGVAYEIEAPMTTFYKLPETGVEVILLTHLAIRDDAHLLFGFASQEERTLFRTLIKVNGVGAKMALTILSGMEADLFAQCIRDGDADSLVRLPGACLLRLPVLTFRWHHHFSFFRNCLRCGELDALCARGRIFITIRGATECSMSVWLHC